MVAQVSSRLVFDGDIFGYLFQNMPEVDVTVIHCECGGESEPIEIRDDRLIQHHILGICQRCGKQLNATYEVDIV